MVLVSKLQRPIIDVSVFIFDMQYLMELGNTRLLLHILVNSE